MAIGSTSPASAANIVIDGIGIGEDHWKSAKWNEHGCMKLRGYIVDYIGHEDPDNEKYYTNWAYGEHNDSVTLAVGDLHLLGWLQVPVSLIASSGSLGLEGGGHIHLYNNIPEDINLTVYDSIFHIKGGTVYFNGTTGNVDEISKYGRVYLEGGTLNFTGGANVSKAKLIQASTGNLNLSGTNNFNANFYIEKPVHFSVTDGTQTFANPSRIEADMDNDGTVIFQHGSVNTNISGIGIVERVVLLITEISNKVLLLDPIVRLQMLSVVLYQI